MQSTYASNGFSVASGAILELNVASGQRISATTTFSGAGTLLKTGAGEVIWGTGIATFALGSGSLINFQEGTLTGGSFSNEVWTNNLSNLNVASGATFNSVEANVRVNKIEGSGTIRTGFTGAGYNNLTIGVDNGSSDFSGVIQNNPTHVGNVVKAGTGTIALGGANTYTGTTTVSGGTLQLGNGGASGSLATASTFSVGTGAVFAVNRSNTVTQGVDFSNTAITGAGGFSQLGTGLTTIT